MTTKKQLIILFFIITNSLNQLICSDENKKEVLVEIIKTAQEDLQQMKTEFIEKIEEKKDNFDFLNLLKASEKTDNKAEEICFLKIEEKVKDFSQNYGYLGKELSIKTIQKICNFVQNKAVLVLSVKPEDKIEFDKIGGISAGLTTIITACLKKRASFAQRTTLPILSGWIVYRLVSTNQEVKESICKKMDLIKRKIK